MKKLKKSNAVSHIVVALATALVIFVGYKAYDFAYTKGKEAGAKQQLICAASIKDETLKSLCK